MRMRGMWDNPTPTGLGSGGPGRRSEPCPGVRPGDWNRNAECGTQERCQEHGICSQDTGWGQHSLGLDSEPGVKGPQGMARLPQPLTLGFLGLVESRPCSRGCAVTLPGRGARDWAIERRGWPVGQELWEVGYRHRDSHRKLGPWLGREGGKQTPPHTWHQRKV